MVKLNVIAKSLRRVEFWTNIEGSYHAAKDWKSYEQ
jgi:hypothetical protein